MKIINTTFELFALVIKSFFLCHLGNGVSDEYHVIRHCMNLEAVNTYEGTFVVINRIAS